MLIPPHAVIVYRAHPLFKTTGTAAPATPITIKRPAPRWASSTCSDTAVTADIAMAGTGQGRVSEGHTDMFRRGSSSGPHSDSGRVFFIAP
jgi:hypothetical protein